MKVPRGRATTEVMEHGKFLRSGMLADGFRLSRAMAKGAIAATGLLPLFACRAARQCPLRHTAAVVKTLTTNDFDVSRVALNLRQCDFS